MNFEPKMDSSNEAKASSRRLSLTLMLLACVSCAGRAQHPRDQRPNLVLILADDQRYDTLSCDGGERVQTPALDRLAAEGARFTRAYVTTSLCCPARASLFTGLYANVHGVRNNEDKVDFLHEHVGFPQLLQESGYATGFFGKWHVYNPGAMPQPGFDRWVSFDGQGQYMDELFNIDGERRRIPGFNTDVLFDLAQEWIAQPREAPFLCVLSLKNLHRPYVIPERHRGALAGQSFPRPESFKDDPEGYPSFIQRVRTTLRNRFFDDGGTHEDNVRGYYTMVLSIDDNVGKLLDSLDEQGLAENTAVVFTSDGGFMWGEHGLYRKRTAYEESIQVPLLVRFPGEIPSHTQLDELALGIDIMPTFLEWAGVALPATLQGRSLRPLWTEAHAAWRKDFLYIDGWGKFVDGPQELAVVGRRYKLVRYRRGQIEEALFDRERDPLERTNRIDDPELAGTVEALHKRLAELIASVGADASWLEPIVVPEEGD